jgi:hypothetical protein
MNRRIQLIILAALAAMLLMTIWPPVTAMSYDNSSGIVKISPVIRYEYLFTKSDTEINYCRLLLQFLIAAIAGAWLVVSQRKVSVSKVAELSVANDKLREHITKGKQAWEQLRQRAVELKIEKENLGCQINELRNAEQKWQTYRAHLEQRVEQQNAELASANIKLQDEAARYKQAEEKLTAAGEQIQQEIAERRQLEESLERQITELRSANEKLQCESDKSKMLEEQFLEHGQQYNQFLKEHSAQVDKYNERLQETMDECEPLTHGREPLKQPEIPSELFDVKKMKELAELARRLSGK